MDYPVNHARPTRQHAGATPKNNANVHALVAVVVAAVALSVEVYELTSGDVRIGLVAAILAVVSSVAGLRCLSYHQRRVHEAEPQVVALGSNAPAPRPRG